ncbi:sulfurtransferase TusA family protein [Thiomicrorhabdus sp.]|uniref:sulfurtransferase TusA family protein n=1 Tax=Thiomicrorhabdus sp. TaxID=2039724 RepID=UPI0029C81F8B|nr:sulfurtransferase TusA family protein [Thiomicrorhabdus sp.]
MNNLSDETIELDARGLKCPMPVIKLQQQVRQSQPENKIRILCTDKGAERDIQSWCKVNKHQLLEVLNDGNLLKITIQVKERK